MRTVCGVELLPDRVLVLISNFFKQIVFIGTSGASASDGASTGSNDTPPVLVTTVCGDLLLPDRVLVLISNFCKQIDVIGLQRGGSYFWRTCSWRRFHRKQCYSF